MTLIEKIEMARLLTEAAHLLTIHGRPNSCPRWIEGIGDCKDSMCMFCRTDKCIERLINKGGELVAACKAEGAVVL